MNRTSARRSILTGAALAATTLTGAALAFAAGGTAGATGKTPRPETSATAHHATGKPTVVLVHGAFADASSWNGVITRLKHHGYPVVATANPLRGLHQDAAHVKSVLDSIDGPIILAGHSYGGSVITEAAAGHPDVKALVYIAAFLPDKAESSAELAGKFPGSTLGPNLNPVPFQQPDGTSGTDLYIKQDTFRAQFAADVPRRTTDLMAATQRPITEAALNDTATRTAWKTIPSWALTTTEDLNIPIAAQRFMTERAGSHTQEIKASHAVTVSRPGTVTRLIQEADHATR